MTFSRLSPGSKRKGVTRSRVTSRDSLPTSRHLRLWEAIRATRDELNRWEAQVNQVDKLFRAHIQPKEQQLTTEFGQLTQRLLEHFSDTTLDDAHLSLLGLWIIENLQSLHAHPFTEKTQLNKLIQQWQRLTRRGGAIEGQLERLTRSQVFMTNDENSGPDNADNGNAADATGNTAGDASKDAAGDAAGDKQSGSNGNVGHEAFDDEDENEMDDSVVFDFGWHKKATHESETGDVEPSDEESDRSAEEPVRDNGAYGHSDDQSSPDDINARVNALEQRLSVERLFRQLARVLHPDREQNETRKAEKHLLMSQCLKARQEKDINTLLTLYCEHVGDLPDELTDNSHNELIQALELQLSQLQQQLHQQRFGNPLHTLIVERYAADSDSLCENNIDQHARSLGREIQSMQRLGAQLEQQQGLMDALVDRKAIELDKLSIDELTGMS